MLVKTITHSFQLANNLGLNSFTIMAFSPVSEYFVQGIFLHLDFSASWTKYLCNCALPLYIQDFRIAQPL